MSMYIELVENSNPKILDRLLRKILSENIFVNKKQNSAHIETVFLLHASKIQEKTIYIII